MFSGGWVLRMPVYFRMIAAPDLWANANRAKRRKLKQNADGHSGCCFVSSNSELERFMYAVFVSGGKQHRVVEGETLKLEKIEVATGETVEFDKVLMVTNGDDVKIGAPVVEGAKVTAEVVSHGRGEKVKIIKFRRRKHSMSRQGHRQWFTEVKITGIKG